MSGFNEEKLLFVMLRSLLSTEFYLSEVASAKVFGNSHQIFAEFRKNETYKEKSKC